MSDPYASGTYVTSRSGEEVGRLTGARFPCTLEGCTGLRLAVQWLPPTPDGRHRYSYPCTKGMVYTRKDGWRIV